MLGSRRTGVLSVLLFGALCAALQTLWRREGVTQAPRRSKKPDELQIAELAPLTEAGSSPKGAFVVPETSGQQSSFWSALSPASTARGRSRRKPRKRRGRRSRNRKRQSRNAQIADSSQQEVLPNMSFANPAEKVAAAPNVHSAPTVDEADEDLMKCQLYEKTQKWPRSTQCYYNHTRCGYPCPRRSGRFTTNTFQEYEPQALDFYYWHHAFLAHKRHKRAFVCGSGPSMNSVDGQLATIIKLNFDVWATNQFYFHNHLVPDFYHIEFLNDTNYMWKWNFIGNQTQHQRFSSTVFFGTGFGDAQSLLKISAGMRARTFLYDAPVEGKASCDAQSGRFYPKCGELAKFCKASMTMVLSLIVAMQYDEVYFLGIDLRTRGHFWTNNEAYSHLRLSDKEEMRSGLKGKHGTVERNFTGFVFNLFDHNRDHVRGFNLSPISQGLLHIPYIPLKKALGQICQKEKKRKHSKHELNSILAENTSVPLKSSKWLDHEPFNDSAPYTGPSFEEVSKTTSAHALICLSRLRTNHWAHALSVESLKSARNEICSGKQAQHFTQNNNNSHVYLTSVYGESIFDASGFCTLCVALLSLFCTVPAFPVMLMHTPEVPDYELALLERTFGAQLVAVPNISPSETCKRQITARHDNLGSVLMKLNYWGFTHLQRIVVFDSDVLFLEKLDVLFKEKYSTPIAAATRGAQRAKLHQSNPVAGVIREGGFDFNGGLVVAHPSKQIFKQLVQAIPDLKSCSSGVEQRLFTQMRKTVFNQVTEIPSAFNCREKETKRVRRSCMVDGMPVHMMHWSRWDNVEPWKIAGNLQRTRTLWAGHGEGSFFLRRWHYLHQRFFGLICPAS